MKTKYFVLKFIMQIRSPKEIEEREQCQQAPDFLNASYSNTRTGATAKIEGHR
jgi:hypothetical protein